ncbi:hypothetical protein PMAYCL1PPCAC_27866, partial [Pristionchus mayeri]
FLSIEDRLKARVSKRLNAIELESNYFVQSLTIGELTGKELISFKKRTISNDGYLNDQEIMIDWAKDNSLDGLRKISQNASI